MCPIISEPDTIDWGEGEEGNLDSFFWILVLQEEARSMLKPHARVQLSHLHTCGFSLQPEISNSKTVWTDPLAPAHSPRGTREQPPSLESTVPSQGCRSSSSPFQVCGETPATESRQQWLEKRNSFPVWQATSSLQH